MAHSPKRRAVEAVLDAFPEEWITVRDDPEAHRRRLERLERHLEPDFAVEATGGGLGSSGRGIDGWLDFWTDWLRGFESFLAEPEGIVEADDRIIVLVHQRGVPSGGRGEIENHAAAVYWFRGDRISRIQLVLDREEALREAGVDPASP